MLAHNLLIEYFQSDGEFIQYNLWLTFIIVGSKEIVAAITDGQHHDAPQRVMANHDVLPCQNIANCQLHLLGVRYVSATKLRHQELSDNNIATMFNNTNTNVAFVT